VLHFDREKHVYTLQDEPESPWNGSRLLSVTEVLRQVGFVDPQWYTDEARERGRRVHRATELLDTEGLDWSSVRPRELGYVKAWERFVDETGWVSREVELPVHSSLYGHAGCIDRIGFYRDDATVEVVTDIKSGGLPKWVPFQVGGYIETLPPMHRRAEAVVLSQDGSWKRKRFTMEELDRGRRVFLSALTVVRSLHELGVIS
jgi:hypothetical protein